MASRAVSVPFRRSDPAPRFTTHEDFEYGFRVAAWSGDERTDEDPTVFVFVDLWRGCKGI